MKKLLSMLGTILLIGTATTSVIACGVGENPNQNKKINLNGLPNNVDVTTLDNNVKIFKIELIHELRNKKFSNLQFSDIDIIKNDGNSLQNSDIKNNKLNIIIIALNTSTNFTGKKTININITTTQDKKNLNSLILNQNLGFIDISSDSIPTKEELLIGIQKANYDASILTANDFDIQSSISDTQTIINGKGEYQGTVTLIYKKEWKFDISQFIDHIIKLYFSKMYGPYLENIQTNINVNEILSNNKISFKKLNSTFENSETSELKNETNFEQQLSTQEYDKQTTNTYSITNKYDVGIQGKIKVPFEETTFNFNFSHSVTNTNTDTTTLRYPSQKINVQPHKKVNVDYDIFLNNIESDYILNLKLNKNSNFSGYLYDASPTHSFGWKKFNFYDFLEKLNINNPSNNNLMYATNDQLYYSIPLTLFGKAHKLNVTISPEQPI